jgi:hypothetical protein
MISVQSVDKPANSKLEIEVEWSHGDVAGTWVQPFSQDNIGTFIEHLQNCYMLTYPLLNYLLESENLLPKEGQEHLVMAVVASEGMQNFLKGLAK